MAKKSGVCAFAMLEHRSFHSRLLSMKAGRDTLQGVRGTLGDLKRALGSDISRAFGRREWRRAVSESGRPC